MRNRLQEKSLEHLMRISSTSMDALTLRKEHLEVLIVKWKRKRDRRMVDQGDISLSGDDFPWLYD